MLKTDPHFKLIGFKFGFRTMSLNSVFLVANLNPRWGLKKGRMRRIWAHIKETRKNYDLNNHHVLTIYDCVLLSSQRYCKKTFKWKIKQKPGEAILFYKALVNSCYNNLPKNERSIPLNITLQQENCRPVSLCHKYQCLCGNHFEKFNCFGNCWNSEPPVTIQSHLQSFIFV